MPSPRPRRRLRRLPPRRRHRRRPSSSPPASPAAPRSAVRWPGRPLRAAPRSARSTSSSTASSSGRRHVSPYVFNGDGNQLDTKTLTDGAHTLAVTARATDGRTATASSAVTVTNLASSPPSLVVTSSIANGATIKGSLVWTASTSGDTVSKVEFAGRPGEGLDGSGCSVPVRRRTDGPVRHDDAHERTAHACGDGLRHRCQHRDCYVVGDSLERSHSAVGGRRRRQHLDRSERWQLHAGRDRGRLCRCHFLRELRSRTVEGAVGRHRARTVQQRNELHVRTGGAERRSRLCHDHDLGRLGLHRLLRRATGLQSLRLVERPAARHLQEHRVR